MQKYRITYVKDFPNDDPLFVYFDTKEAAMATLHAQEAKGAFQTQYKPVPGLHKLAFGE